MSEMYSPVASQCEVRREATAPLLALSEWMQRKVAGDGMTAAGCFPQSSPSLVMEISRLGDT